MKTDMTITVNKELQLEDFETVIVGALEGNAKKWALIKATEFLKKMPTIDKFFIGKNERIAYALFSDSAVKLPVYDKKTKRQIGYVTRETLKRAFSTFAEKYSKRWKRLQEHEHTPEDVDIIFQIAALGEPRN